MADRKRPTRNSVTVNLNKQARRLKNPRIIGQVSIRKFTDRGRLRIEISGIEIDGFGGHQGDKLDTTPPM